MKKFFKSVTDMCNRATMNTAVKVECLLANNRGEGYMDTGVFS